MKKNKIKKEISVVPILDQPEDNYDIINKYGTYEIQPTADTINTFPAIAQGNPDETIRMHKDDVIKKMKKDQPEL